MCILSWILSLPNARLNWIIVTKEEECLYVYIFMQWRNIKKAKGISRRLDWLLIRTKFYFFYSFNEGVHFQVQLKQFFMKFFRIWFIISILLALLILSYFGLLLFYLSFLCPCMNGILVRAPSDVTQSKFVLTRKKCG